MESPNQAPKRVYVAVFLSVMMSASFATDVITCEAWADPSGHGAVTCNYGIDLAKEQVDFGLVSVTKSSEENWLTCNWIHSKHPTCQSRKGYIFDGKVSNHFTVTFEAGVASGTMFMCQRIPALSSHTRPCSVRVVIPEAPSSTQTTPELMTSEETTYHVTTPDAMTTTDDSTSAPVTSTELSSPIPTDKSREVATPMAEKEKSFTQTTDFVLIVVGAIGGLIFLLVVLVALGLGLFFKRNRQTETVPLAPPAPHTFRRDPDAVAAVMQHLQQQQQHQRQQQQRQRQQQKHKRQQQHLPTNSGESATSDDLNNLYSEIPPDDLTAAASSPSSSSSSSTTLPDSESGGSAPYALPDTSYPQTHSSSMRPVLVHTSRNPFNLPRPLYVTPPSLIQRPVPSLPPLASPSFTHPSVSPSVVSNVAGLGKVSASTRRVPHTPRLKFVNWRESEAEESEEEPEPEMDEMGYLRPSVSAGGNVQPALTQKGASCSEDRPSHVASGWHTPSAAAGKSKLMQDLAGDDYLHATAAVRERSCQERPEVMTGGASSDAARGGTTDPRNQAEHARRAGYRRNRNNDGDNDEDDDRRCHGALSMMSMEHASCAFSKQVPDDYLHPSTSADQPGTGFTSLPTSRSSAKPHHGHARFERLKTRKKGSIPAGFMHPLSQQPSLKAGLDKENRSVRLTSHCLTSHFQPETAERFTGRKTLREERSTATMQDETLSGPHVITTPSVSAAMHTLNPRSMLWRGSSDYVPHDSPLLKTRILAQTSQSCAFPPEEEIDSKSLLVSSPTAPTTTAAQHCPNVEYVQQMSSGVSSASTTMTSVCSPKDKDECENSPHMDMTSSDRKLSGDVDMEKEAENHP